MAQCSTRLKQSNTRSATNHLRLLELQASGDPYVAFHSMPCQAAPSKEATWGLSRTCSAKPNGWRKPRATPKKAKPTSTTTGILSKKNKCRTNCIFSIRLLLPCLHPRRAQQRQLGSTIKRQCEEFLPPGSRQQSQGPMWQTKKVQDRGYVNFLLVSLCLFLFPVSFVPTQGNKELSSQIGGGHWISWMTNNWPSYIFVVCFASIGYIGTLFTSAQQETCSSDMVSSDKHSGPLIDSKLHAMDCNGKSPSQRGSQKIVPAESHCSNHHIFQ